MNCSQCGSPLAPGAAFCGECGAPVAANPQPVQQQQQPAMTQPAANTAAALNNSLNELEKTKIFNFANPLFKLIDTGSFFRKPFQWLYIILAVFNAVFPLYILFKMIEEKAFDALGISGFMAWIVVAFVGWIGLQLWWNRKDKIGMYASNGDDFIVTPTFSHFLQTFGEYAGISIAIIGVGFSLIGWIFLSGERGGYYSRSLPGGQFLQIGIVGIIVSPLLGFMIIVLSRLMAELYRALTAIANNTKKMANKS